MPELAAISNDLREIYIKANAYMAKDCLDFAESLYQDILEYASHGAPIAIEILADIYHNLGMIAERRNLYDIAIGYYEHSLELNSRRDMTWVFLARLYLLKFEQTQARVDYDAGKRALRKAETINASLPVIRLLKARYLIA